MSRNNMGNVRCSSYIAHLKEIEYGCFGFEYGIIRSS